MLLIQNAIELTGSNITFLNSHISLWSFADNVGLKQDFLFFTESSSGSVLQPNMAHFCFAEKQTS